MIMRVSGALRQAQGMGHGVSPREWSLRMPPTEVPPRARSVPAGLRPEDFDEIREAVMETARGRWFLDEYATRLRLAETSGLRDGMKRLELAIAANHDELMGRLAAALAEEQPEEPAPREPAPRPDLRLAPRHMKYYRADEDVFEPAPDAVAAPPDHHHPPQAGRTLRRAPRRDHAQGVLAAGGLLSSSRC